MQLLDIWLTHESQPKEKRRRSGAHEQSVKLHKRQYAAQDNAVEHVDVGEQSERAVSPHVASRASVIA